MWRIQEHSVLVVAVDNKVDKAEYLPQIDEALEIIEQGKSLIFSAQIFSLAHNWFACAPESGGCCGFRSTVKQSVGSLVLEWNCWLSVRLLAFLLFDFIAWQCAFCTPSWTKVQDDVTLKKAPSQKALQDI
jgi:hypothetical protein